MALPNQSSPDPNTKGQPKAWKEMSHLIFVLISPSRYQHDIGRWVNCRKHKRYMIDSIKPIHPTIHPPPVTLCACFLMVGGNQGTKVLILHKLTSGTEPTAPQMNQDLKIKLTDFYFLHHTAVSSGLHSNMASKTQESALGNPSLSPWFLTTLN